MCQITKNWRISTHTHIHKAAFFESVLNLEYGVGISSTHGSGLHGMILQSVKRQRMLFTTSSFGAESLQPWLGKSEQHLLLWAVSEPPALPAKPGWLWLWPPCSPGCSCRIRMLGIPKKSHLMVRGKFNLLGNKVHRAIIDLYFLNICVTFVASTKYCISQY